MSAAVYFAFFNRIPNSAFIFKDGSLAAFTNGRYTTQDESKAAELQAEIKAGNPHIYVDAEKLTLTEEELDPMAEYKARVIAEYLAAQATDGTADRGNSEKEELKPATTADIAVATVSSSTSGIKVGPK